jgi:hypothetical protein
MKTPWFTLLRRHSSLGPDSIKRALPHLAVAVGAAVFAVITSEASSHGRSPDAAEKAAKEARTAKAARDMAKAAEAFLASLTAEQRGKAVYSFDSAERENWHFVPRTRNGLPFKDMTPEQRAKAEALIRTGLSARGWTAARTIIDLEHVLRYMENNNQGRDSTNYFVTVFGTPGTGNAPWGWRFEGHHLAINVTLANGSVAATTPMFFGANPGEVRIDVPNAPQAPKKGTRALAAREDLGRRLFQSLTAEQKKTALLADKAYSDIQTGNRKQIDPLTPEGVSVKTFNKDQQKIVRDLLDDYVGVMVPDIGKDRRDRAMKAGIDKIHFAWAGSGEPGQGHYYRLQGPTFLLEYDNTQNDANHVHSAWRDFAGDFGRDVLAEHRAAAHQANGTPSAED